MLPLSAMIAFGISVQSASAATTPTPKGSISNAVATQAKGSTSGNVPSGNVPSGNVPSGNLTSGNLTTSSEATVMVTLTNRLRATMGADNLAIREDLNALACSWADKMVETNVLEHSTFIHDKDLFNSRLGRDWVLAGENVGVGPDVYTIHGALVGSPLHFRNLVNPTFLYVGICVRRTPDGTVFVAEEFLAPKTPPKRPASRRA